MNIDFSFGEDGSCPTSTHRKKQHRGVTQSRRTIVKQLTLGKRTFPSTSYIDSLKCVHCEATGEVEWMPA